MSGLQRPFALPTGAVEVILVRHGAAVDEGAVEYVDGQGDPPLGALGQRQAEEVAHRLMGHCATSQLFVSPLRRTQQTAAPLAARLGVSPAVVAELREVHLGEWELGHTFATRFATRDPLVRRLLKEQRWEVIPGAETSAALARRVRRGIDHVVQAASGPSVAVFTHAGVIAEACRQATESRPFAFLAAENTSVSRLIVDQRGRWRLRAFNEVSHLT